MSDIPDHTGPFGEIPCPKCEPPMKSKLDHDMIAGIFGSEFESVTPETTYKGVLVSNILARAKNHGPDLAALCLSQAERIAALEACLREACDKCPACKGSKLIQRIPIGEGDSGSFITCPTCAGWCAVAKGADNK